jgi:hypothetical protein
VYSARPDAVIEGWPSLGQTHAPLKRVDFHYHDVEEWLEVVRGDITFCSLSGQTWLLHAGSVLHIPRGEVHRADIGAAGVEYRMYSPVEIATGFANTLNADEIDLLRTNLAFPIREENTDGRAAEFFAAHLSDQLAFCRADGTVVGKEAFREGFTARGRSASGTINVLNRSANSLLLSTDVTMTSGGSSRKTFTNVRLFVKEGDAWRCRIWVNFAA